MSPLPITIARDEPLTTAHRLMRENGIRHLPVLEGRTLVGLLSMDDMHLLESFPNVDPKEAKVEEAMSPHPLTVAPDASLQGVAADMAKRGACVAVVLENGELLGMFTSSDALRALVEVCRSIHQVRLSLARLGGPLTSGS